MTGEIRRTFLKMLAGITVAALVLPAFGQGAYPTKPIKIIAPVQPGGGVDLVARTIADRLGRVLGQSIIVDNQSGGGGVVGLDGDRARSARRLHADGRLRRHARHQPGGAQAAVRRGQGFHADRDGRRHAERAGRAAVGAGQHARGIRRLREGQSRQALVRLVGSGHADAPRDGAAEGRRRPRHRARPVSRHRPGDHRHPGRPDAGALSRARRRAAAHQGGQDEAAGRHRPQRHPLLPDVPTFEESGYKGFDGVQWYGIVGPANMPAPIVKRLNDGDQQAAGESRTARATLRARRWSRCR